MECVHVDLSWHDVSFRLSTRLQFASPAAFRQVGAILLLESQGGMAAVLVGSVWLFALLC